MTPLPKGTPLPEDATVIRGLNHSHIKKEKVNSAAFLLKKEAVKPNAYFVKRDDDLEGLSVSTCAVKLRALWNAERTCSIPVLSVRRNKHSQKHPLDVKADPIDPIDGKPGNDEHALIVGLPDYRNPDLTDLAFELAEELAALSTPDPV